MMETSKLFASMRQISLDPEYSEDVDLHNVNALARISIASPHQILQWSRCHCRQSDRRGICKCGKPPEEQEKCPFGEVKKPETINYRTFKPEKDGLFCERIFGPTKDWECSCGKYKRIKYKGIVCDRCGVEVIESKVRRTRMGHIKLAAPVCHIWFYKGTSSVISNLLEMRVRDLGKVIYFQEYIVVDSGESPLKEKQLLTEEECRKYKEVYGDSLVIGIGAEAVKGLLSKIDVEDLSNRLSLEMRQATSAQKRSNIIKRLKIVDAFKNSGNDPSWMILTVLPVIPPDLRPLVHLDGGRFATSDLNDLYRRVINRNNRLKRLTELKAPEVILRNEKRMLQEAVDALFDNSRRARPTKGHNNRPLKSLSDMLKGKQGRFRQNLLGKRVDYSGRSVIVVGPELQFNQCGLPKRMAVELFDPFIIRELQQRGYCNTIKSAKRMMEQDDPVVYDILDDIIQDHPVLLNRAPTLHRLGIQAFMPVMVEGKAIKLHPLACTAFNADFDGDQMAVHIPLSAEAKLEAKLIMLAENNILLPANGKPVATPTQDIVLGCYYLTKSRKGAHGTKMCFSSPMEVIQAYNNGKVHLQAPVEVRCDNIMISTTPGRIIFSAILPPEISFFDERYSFSNRVMTKKYLSDIIALCHKLCGPDTTSHVLDEMKNLGFEHAKLAGLSIGIDDMMVPDSKSQILEKARNEVRHVQSQYEKGSLTDEERYHKVIDVWTRATDLVAAEMLIKLKMSQDGFNPIYLMANSGARGSEQQIKQLAGMRGLMQRPTKRVTGEVGEIIESPIRSNFREGLTVLEYFISTHGARKGLADTALKTSDAGYLTRRLVDVAQDLIITEHDCGTHNGIYVKAIKEITPTGERKLESLSERIVGRYASENIKYPGTRKIICKRNQEITWDIAQAIEDADIESVPLRSVLTCDTIRGVCTRCYGRNLATGKLVETGEAIGVIAAESIGEPGTQLTLRTFHIGGMASIELEGWYQAASEGKVVFENIKSVKTKEGGLVVINRTGSIRVIDDDKNVLQRLPNIPYGARINLNDRDMVTEGQKIVEWDPHHTPIIAEVEGLLKFDDIILHITMKEDLDPITNIAQLVISEHKEDRHPQLMIVDKKGKILNQYALPSGAIIIRGLKDDSEVKPGMVLARLPRTVTRSRDITGGLPRVDELFEGRRPKDCAIIADVAGTFQFKGISKGLRKVTVTTDSGEERNYSIPVMRHIIVRDGDKVQAGEPLTDGSISPHDVLRIKGEKATQEFLLGEIQEVYRLQGVYINDKHIECIIRQMLKKVVVEDVGSTKFLFGQQVDKWNFQEENRNVVKKGGDPATAKPRLFGLTKASLETESFISAASFQETTRVLTDAAVRGRIDHLRGLKENIIMGLLIPAGTGFTEFRDVEVSAMNIGESRKSDET